MPRLFRSRSGRVGASPGTIEYRGPRRVERMTLHVMAYDPGSCDERQPGGVEEALAAAPAAPAAATVWLNADGLHDIEGLRRLCDHHGLHPLVQEDIVNTHQRPKLEDYGDYLYIVCRMISCTDGGGIASEQVSLAVGPDWVLSFQEEPGDVFTAVRERIRQGKGRIRGAGPAYLAYALLDAVIDSYFVVLERMGERIERLEEDLLREPEAGLLAAIHALKREMIVLRRAVWPLREVVSGLERGDSPLVHEGTRVYYRDLYDHAIQVADAVETYRDLLTGLQDLYLSSVSNRLNEVIKFLTIVGTLFIPLTFLVGVYGMNFEHMPELGWRWSYPLFGLLCAGVAGGMLLWLRRRGWL
jgi:magnesium transporter